eukprot:1196148-Prorocentrum_minimum.AAC.4
MHPQGPLGTQAVQHEATHGPPALKGRRAPIAEEGREYTYSGHQSQKGGENIKAHLVELFLQKRPLRRSAGFVEHGPKVVSAVVLVVGALVHGVRQHAGVDLPHAAHPHLRGQL